jgi:hypothetical protein
LVTGGTGGVGGLLGTVSVLELGAVSVLDEVFVLGMALEVVAVGKDRVQSSKPSTGLEDCIGTRFQATSDDEI